MTAETQPVPFDVRGGLIGDPIPATVIGNGCRVFNYVRIADGGHGIRTMAGWRRRFNKSLREAHLSGYPLDYSRKIVAFRGDNGCGVNGTMFAFLDWTNPLYARILSFGLNEQLKPELVGGGWNAGADDSFVLSEFGGDGVPIGRMSPREFPPAPITFRGRTFFNDRWMMP